MDNDDVFLVSLIKESKDSEVEAFYYALEEDVKENSKRKDDK